MPGSNHSFETKFINDTPLRLRDTCRYLLEKYSLSQMLSLQQKQERPEQLVEMSDAEWEAVLRAVILSKLTYFNLNTDLLTKQHLSFITFIFVRNFNRGSDLNEILRQVTYNYSVLEIWLQDLIRQRKRLGL